LGVVPDDIRLEEFTSIGFKRRSISLRTGILFQLEVLTMRYFFRAIILLFLS